MEKFKAEIYGLLWWREKMLLIQQCLCIDKRFNSHHQGILSCPSSFPQAPYPPINHISASPLSPFLTNLTSIYRPIIFPMKLDNREKYDKLRRYITQLKQKKTMEPFIDLEEIVKFGIYDFWYINKNPPSFAKIEKKIKESKYDQLGEFLEDLKQIFIAVSDYAFSDDPIQKVCEEFKEEIDRFGQNFIEQFRPIVEHKIIKPPRVVVVAAKPKEVVKEAPVPPAPIRTQPIPVEELIYRQRASSLSQKLQMLFLLRANQNNEPYLRSIGTHYGIGMQIQQNYVLTINDRNKLWLQFIDRNQ